MQDEPQRPGADAGDAEIEMPPDPASTGAAAQATSAIDEGWREVEAIADEDDWF